jgi:hypothetical protein
MFKNAKTFFRCKQKYLLLLLLLWFYGEFYITYFPKYMKYNMTQDTEHIPSKSYFVRAISQTVSRTGC